MTAFGRSMFRVLALLPLLVIGRAVADDPASSKVAVESVATTAAVGPGVSQDAVEILLIAGPAVKRVRIEVRSGGQSLATVQQEAIEQLVRFADVDGDSRISRGEARLLPATQVLRQFAWGEFFPFAPRQSEFDTLDTDHDGFVTAVELTAHCRAAGLGRLAVHVAGSAELARLDAALFSRLDLNADGRVMPDELRRAEELLSRLDTDHDDVLARAEILEGLSPVRRDDAPTGRIQPPPFLVLRPADTADLWTKTFITLRGGEGMSLPRDHAGFSVDVAKDLDRDANGLLTADELDGLRNLSPDETWIVDLAPRSTEAAEPTPSTTTTDRRREMEAAGVRLELLPREGLVEKRWSAYASSLRDRLRELDADQDGAVTAEEARLPHRIDFPQVVTAADRDGDGRLTAKELEAFLTVQQGLAALHARLDLIDRGRSLFDALDANGDELLSVRELRTAIARLSVTDSTPLTPPLTTGALHRIRATASCGKPSPILFETSLAAPEWFRAMDRNRDGDLSRREFTGPAAAFLRLDRNGDGLIAPDELAGDPPRRASGSP